MEWKLKTDDVKKHYREYDISGDISVQNIEVLVDEMKTCITDCDHLVLNFRGITGFDTAAFQFFYSLKNSFVRDKKKLVANCNLSAEVKQLLKNVGIEDLAQVISFDSEK